MEIQTRNEYQADLYADSYIYVDRKIEDAKKIWDTTMTIVRGTLLLACFLSPELAPLFLTADAVLGTTDGAMKIYQGDTVEGAFEISMSLFEVAAAANIELSLLNKAKTANIVEDKIDDAERLAQNVEQYKNVPDNEIDYYKLMPEDDLKRYQQWNFENEAGIHNNHPGLTQEDLTNWAYADQKVAESEALAKVDANEVLKLRQANNTSNSIFSNPNDSNIFESIDDRFNSLIDDVRSCVGKKYPVGNAGAAITDIEGVTPEIKAYSKFNNTINSSNLNHDFSYNFGEGNRIFNTIDVNSDNIVNGPKAFNRCIDTESKILEDIAHQLGYMVLCQVLEQIKMGDFSN